jgi:SagB-type dehydrogenase family enzyme
MTESEDNFLTYHQNSMNSGLSAPFPISEWPKEWLTVYYKAYPRFPRVELPIPSTNRSVSLEDMLARRTARREFDASQPLTLEEVSFLLRGIGQVEETLAGRQDLRRSYPSAGGRYPLEAYVVPLRVNGLKPAVHHYHVRTHSLEQLWSFSQDEFEQCFMNDEWCQSAGLAVFLAASYRRTSMKYRNRAYRYCLLEAGHAAQNMLLLAEAKNLGACPYGGFCDEPVMRLLDLNPGEELPLYALFFGKLAR